MLTLISRLLDIYEFLSVGDIPRLSSQVPRAVRGPKSMEARGLAVAMLGTLEMRRINPSVFPWRRLGPWLRLR